MSICDDCVNRRGIKCTIIKQSAKSKVMQDDICGFYEKQTKAVAYEDIVIPDKFRRRSSGTL